MKRAWLLLLVAALVAGCGQKGPLYLPDKNAKVVTTPASAAPAPEVAPAAQPPAAPAAKPHDKDQDQSSPPKP